MWLDIFFNTIWDFLSVTWRICLLILWLPSKHFILCFLWPHFSLSIFHVPVLYSIKLYLFYFVSFYWCEVINYIFIMLYCTCYVWFFPIPWIKQKYTPSCQPCLILCLNSTLFLTLSPISQPYCSWFGAVVLFTSMFICLTSTFTNVLVLHWYQFFLLKIQTTLKTDS